MGHESIRRRKHVKGYNMRYITLLFLASIVSASLCDAAPTRPSVEEASSMLLSRKQVTAHNCDSAAEAMAQAESRNSGWTAYNARNVGGRTWVVSMKQN